MSLRIRQLCRRCNRGSLLPTAKEHPEFCDGHDPLYTSIAHDQTESDPRKAIGIPRRRIKRPRLVQLDATESDCGSRTELSQSAEIGRNDVSDVRIASHRAAGDTQHDQTAAGHLDRAGRVRRAARRWFWGSARRAALQPQTRAVADRADSPFPACPPVGTKAFQAVPVGAVEYPKRLGGGITPAPIPQVTRCNCVRGRFRRYMVARDEPDLGRAAPQADQAFASLLEPPDKPEPLAEIVPRQALRHRASRSPANERDAHDRPRRGSKLPSRHRPMRSPADNRPETRHLTTLLRGPHSREHSPKAHSRLPPTARQMRLPPARPTCGIRDGRGPGP